jgi:hypothetical protein
MKVRGVPGEARPVGGRAEPDVGLPQRQRANLDIFGLCLAGAEMGALAALDLGEDAAVDSDERAEF